MRHKGEPISDEKLERFRHIRTTDPDLPMWALIERLGISFSSAKALNQELGLPPISSGHIDGPSNDRVRRHRKRKRAA